MTRAQADALLAYVEAFVVMHAAVHTAARHDDPIDAATMLTRQAAEARAAFLATVDAPFVVHYLGAWRGSHLDPDLATSACRMVLSREGHLLADASREWARVTCPVCLAKKP